jgi:hypothetical protein
MPLARTNVTNDQVRNILTYNDQLAAGAGLEVTGGTIENNLQAVISQINRVLNSTVAGNDWYVDINTTASGKQRGVRSLNTDLAAVEEQTFLFRTTVLTDVGITVAQNFEILSAAGSETPSVAAANTGVNQGAVAAGAPAGFGTGRTPAAAVAVDEIIPGADVLNPKNLARIVDNVTGDIIESSSGFEIYALLASAASTNSLFNDTTNRGELIFVERNAGGTGLVYADPGDIGGRTINYGYVRRLRYENLPEEAFLTGQFADQSASVDVTRQNAYTNQAAAVVTTSVNATLDLGSALFWEIGDNTSATVLRLTEGSGGGTSAMTVGAAVDVYDNNAVDVDFDNGIQVDVGSNPINLGITPNQIDFTGNAVVTTASSSSMTLRATSAALTLSTITSGTLAVTSAGLLDVDAAANIDVDVTGSFDLLSTGVFSIDGTGASNVSVTSGVLTLSTITSGNLVLTGADAITLTAGNEAAATGNLISLTAGTGGGNNPGGAITLVGGVGGVGGSSGVGGPITLTGGAAGTGSTANGGNIVLTTGAADGAGVSGFVHVTGPNSQGQALMQFTSAGASGDSVQLFVGDSNPNGAVTGLAGSLFLRDTGTGGEVYVNTSTGAGTTWSQLTAGSGSELTRNFFQDTIVTQVAPGNPLTDADVTSGALPTKPAANFTFNVDAEVYLNGILLMNGVANEVSSGTGDNIDVGATGPTFQVGDVITIVYYTNSTST